MEDAETPVAKISVDIFINHILPPLHESFTPAKLEEMSRQLRIKHCGSQNPAHSPETNRWTAFDEAENASTEHATYGALATIAKRISAEFERTLKDKCPKQLFDFVADDNSAPVPWEQDSKSRPAGYFVLREESHQTRGTVRPKTRAKSKETVHWTDIGPTGEYMLDDSEQAVRDVSRPVLPRPAHF